MIIHTGLFLSGNCREQWRHGCLITVPQAWGVETMRFLFFAVSILIRGRAGGDLFWSLLVSSFHTDTAWAIGAFWVFWVNKSLCLVFLCLFAEVSCEAPDFKTDYCTRTQQYNVLSEGEFNWLDLLSKYTHHWMSSAERIGTFLWPRIFWLNDRGHELLIRATFRLWVQIRFLCISGWNPIRIS